MRDEGGRMREPNLRQKEEGRRMKDDPRHSPEALVTPFWKGLRREELAMKGEITPF